jgi:hypothetical protein
MKTIALLFVGCFCVSAAAISGCGSDTSTSSTASTTSASTSTTSASASSGTSSSSSGMAVLSCDDYCNEVATNCSDDATKQYKDNNTCLAACVAFPAGHLTDMMGNTLGCRLYHGGAPAMSDPATHCPHAGPGGAGQCGSNCEGFCEIALKACTGTMAQYTDSNDCMTKCAQFPDTVKYSASVTSGNTLACRLYHATVATVDPVTHCGHIGVMSPVCM